MSQRRPFVEPDFEEEWSQGGLPGPSLRQRLTDGVIIGLGALALGAVALVVFAFLGNALDEHDAQAGQLELVHVEPGQCLDYASPPVDSDVLPSVRLVDCAQAHDAELIGRFGWQGSEPNDDLLAYPGLGVLDAYAWPRCEAIFADYVGVHPIDSEYSLSHVIPLRSAWVQGGGGRDFHCLVSAWDEGSKVTGSVRDARR